MAIVAAAVLLGLRSLLSVFQTDSVEHMPREATTTAIWAYSLAAVALAAAWLLHQNRRNTTEGMDEHRRPPWAPGVQLPFLGHALSYKKDPPNFLSNASEQVGPVFRMNLAGLKTTIVSSRSAMKAVATAPESQLSARQAVSDFGFRYTLGDANVFRGTDVHKHVLKAFVYASHGDTSASGGTRLHANSSSTSNSNCSGSSSSSNSSGSSSSNSHSSSGSSGAAHQNVHPTMQLAAALAPWVYDGMERAFPRNQDLCYDFLGAMRRVAFHAVAGHLIGWQVLEAYRNFSVNGRAFVDDFMAFQDQVEEATAKGATLPAPLARALMWKPVQRQREALTRRLSNAVATAAAFAVTAEATHKANHRKKGDADSIEGAPQSSFDDGLGIWLRAALKGGIAKKTPPSSSSSSASSTATATTTQGAEEKKNEEGVDSSSPNMSFAECADLLVGLLFAAHKNPAIAAAQAVLMAIEDHFDTAQRSGASSTTRAPTHLDKVGNEASGGIVEATTAATAANFSANASPSAVSLKRPNIKTLAQLFPTSTAPTPAASHASAIAAGSATTTAPTTVTCAVVNEAMRLSAHSLGAIRKVVAPEGFAVPLDDESSLNNNCSSSKDTASEKARGSTKATTGAASKTTTTAPPAARAPPPAVVAVPCGEYVGVSHLLPHLNSRVFPHPKRFLPSRFLPKMPASETVAITADFSEEEQVRGSALGLGPYDLTTFSHGIHVCPGQRYAQVLVQLMVAAVIDGPLHEFLGAGSAEAPSGTTIPPLDFTRATLAQRKGPVALPCKWR